MRTLRHATDMQLVHTFQEGNDDSLEVLVKRYQDKIFTSIYILVQDKHLAEDLFQDTFTKIIDHLRRNRYREEGKFLAWATQIARNLCVDHFRKMRCSATISKDKYCHIFDIVNGAEVAFEKSLIQKETHRDLRSAIESLSEKQREVIVLRHYADLSFKEIAALVGCRVNTALGRMHYGLLNIRKMMLHEKV